MHFTPQAAFDAVVVRAVRWQQVQHDPPVQALDERPRLLAAVHAVVVQDHVNPPRGRVGLRQLLQQRDEQRAAFLLAHLCRKLQNSLLKMKVGAAVSELDPLGFRSSSTPSNMWKPISSWI